MQVNRYVNGKRVERRELAQYTIRSEQVRKTLARVERRIHGE